VGFFIFNRLSIFVYITPKILQLIMFLSKFIQK
jgi:hypothetical protein